MGFETNDHEHSYPSVSILLKNESDLYEHSSLFVPSSLKNETGPYEHGSPSVSISLKNESDLYEHMVLLLCQAR